jgi:hypothetical protein
MTFYLGAKSVHVGLLTLYGYILSCLHPFEVWDRKPSVHKSKNGWWFPCLGSDGMAFCILAGTGATPH